MKVNREESFVYSKIRREKTQNTTGIFVRHEGVMSRRYLPRGTRRSNACARSLNSPRIWEQKKDLLAVGFRLLYSRLVVFMMRERENGRIYRLLTLDHSSSVKREICGNCITFCIESRGVANLCGTFTFTLVTTVRWNLCKGNICGTFTSKINSNKCLSAICSTRVSA